MDMKELYTAPVMDVIVFPTLDIVTTSAAINNDAPELPVDQL